MNRGLTSRIVAGCVAVAVLNASAFIVLLSAISDEHNQSREARRVRSELSRTDDLERAVAHVHASGLVFALTSDERSLDDWNAAQAAVGEQADQLVAAVDQPELVEQMQQLVDTSARYITEYAVPVVDAWRRGSPVAASADTIAEGERRVVVIGDQARALRQSATELLESRQHASDQATRRGILAASIGLAGSILLMVWFAAYLVRTVLGPLRRASGMAGRLAGGDLSVRLPESGRGEIGELERSFNLMASDLGGARDDLVATADEQAALHRVAALVAERRSPTDVFEAVVEEIARLFGASSTVLLRYEPRETAIVLAAHDAPAGAEAGSELELANDPGVDVVTTSTPDGPASDAGRTRADNLAARVRSFGLESAVSAPIVVDNQPWGAVVVAWRTAHPSLSAIAGRIEEFTELAATAIANAEDRTKLASSRARLVTAGDQARRRIERDLHDGTQQRLVALGLEVRLARSRVPENNLELDAELGRISDDVAAVVTELQELSRGIHPAILSQGGLAPALRALSRRAALPVEVTAHDEQRVPEPVEIAAYYIVSEAITNATKHAEASVVEVEVRFASSWVHLDIADDGKGGADMSQGSGLIGLHDRVDALGGTIVIDSTLRRGTAIRVTLPYPAPVT